MIGADDGYRRIDCRDGGHRMAECFFGPAGWSYPDWKGTVYPPEAPSRFNALEFLARDFDFVEVNTTFYRIPDLRLTGGWAAKTRHLDHFAFWVKLPGDFTHQRKLETSAVAAFLRSLAPLRESSKLLGLLAQFPYSFKFSDENFDFLNRLADEFAAETLAVEFRHNSWDRIEVLDFFRRRNLIWTNIDQPVISSSLPLTAHLTHADTSYFRLHGRNYQNWFSGEGRDARYDYLYSAPELGQIAGAIRRLKEQAKKIFVSGNNHYKGNAVKNLLQLKEMIAAE
jgi:uncharacterized protein YecE (DUF72 family)